MEISDIVIVVMDIRHPLLHFPKPLYDYVTRDLKRKIVGVFNKVRLASMCSEINLRLKCLSGGFGFRVHCFRMAQLF